MKNITTLLFVLLTSNLLFGSCAFNGSFENLYCNSSSSIYTFVNGCAGPAWNCLRAIPQLNLTANSPANYGPAADGDNFAILKVGNASGFDQLGAIYYDTGVGSCIEFGKSYNISFSAKLATQFSSPAQADDKLRLRVFAMSKANLTPDCGWFGPNYQYDKPPVPASADDVIVDEILSGSNSWKDFNVTKVLAPTPNDGPMVIVVYGQYVSGGTFLLGFDDFQVEESDDEINKCRVPENIDCSIDTQGNVTFFWDPVSFAAFYQVVVAFNAVTCGCEPIVGPQLTFYPTTNQLTIDLSTYQKPCFLFRIRSICDDDDFSDFSDPFCYNSSGCFEPLVGETIELERSQDSGSLDKSDLLNVFPNPSTGLVNINGSEDFEIAEVVVYNTVGQVVNINKAVVDNKHVMDLPAGTYVAKIISTNGEISSKMVFITD